MKNTMRVLSKILMKGLVMVLATLFIQGGTWAIAKKPTVVTEKLTVMTQNLYVGAEIESLASFQATNSRPLRASFAKVACLPSLNVEMYSL